MSKGAVSVVPFKCIWSLLILSHISTVISRPFLSTTKYCRLCSHVRWTGERTRAPCPEREWESPLARGCAWHPNVSVPHLHPPIYLRMKTEWQCPHDAMTSRSVAQMDAALQCETHGDGGMQSCVIISHWEGLCQLFTWTSSACPRIDWSDVTRVPLWVPVSPLPSVPCTPNNTMRWSAMVYVLILISL